MEAATAVQYNSFARDLIPLPATGVRGKRMKMSPASRSTRRSRRPASGDIQNKTTVRIGFEIIKTIESALMADSLDDLLEAILSQLLQLDRVRRIDIHLFNKKERLVLVASGRNTSLKGSKKQELWVQSWHIDSPIRHTTRRKGAPSHSLAYTIPLVQSSTILGFLGVDLAQIPLAADNLKPSLYLVGLQLATKIQELRLRDEIGKTNGELQRALTDNRQSRQRITALSKELYAISAISTKINQSMDLKKSLRKSMLKIKAVFKVSGVMVYLKAPSRFPHEWEIVRIDGNRLNSTVTGNVVAAVEQNFNAARSTFKGHPSPHFGHLQQDPSDGEHSGSVVAVPMIFKMKLIGTLILILEPTRQFNQDNLRLLSGIANIMAMAIENRRLYRESEQKKKEAAFLVNSILKFNQTLDLELTLKSIAEKGGEFFGRQCRVYLLSETRIPMVRHIRHNRNRPNTSQTEAFSNIQPRALKHFYTQMLHQNRSVVIGRIESSRRMKRSLKVYFKAEDVNAMIAVPMKLAYKPMGLLLLGSKRSGKMFHRHELAMVEALGAAAAVSIEHVWAYDASAEMSAFLEQKIYEKTNQIRHIRERQQIRIENRKDAIFQVSKNNRFVFVNKAMENLTGLSRDELYRENFGADDVVAPEDRKYVRNGFRKIVNRELAIIKDLECRLLSKKGEEHVIALTIYPEKDQSGRVIGVEGVGHDITEKKRLEAELEKTKDLALLGEFSGAIAHQVRNPLSNILMGTKLLKRAVGLDVLEPRDERQSPNTLSSISVNREKLADIFKNLSDGIYNLNQVVTELVEYTKTLKPRRTYQQIDTILNETLTALEERGVQNGIGIKKYFEPGLPPISVDAVLIGQVFQNLVHNATEAMESGGWLFVAAGMNRKTPNSIMISIGDTGIGVEAEQLEKIFHPFFTTKDTGTGFGLSLAHRIVDAHKGKIWACQNPCPHQIFDHAGGDPVFPSCRRGLTFHIILPIDMQQ